MSSVVRLSGPNGPTVVCRNRGWTAQVFFDRLEWFYWLNVGFDPTPETTVFVTIQRPNRMEEIKSAASFMSGGAYFVSWSVKGRSCTWTVCYPGHEAPFNFDGIFGCVDDRGVFHSIDCFGLNYEGRPVINVTIEPDTESRDAAIEDMSALG